VIEQNEIFGNIPATQLLVAMAFIFGKRGAIGF
jgi:hypothetical protein